MSKCAKFTLSFNLDFTNEERIAMFQFYQNAFHARKTYEGTPPDSDDIHIMMDIYGVENLIGPGVAPGSGNSICCEIRFTDENEFCRAYGILTQESKSHSLEGPFPWAARSGLVEDKFGVGWALYYNE